MKTILLLLFAASVCVSCATQHTVKKIVFNNSTHSSSYYGETITGTAVTDVAIKKEDAMVSEGSDVQIVVENYNPLNHEFTVQQDANALFYISTATEPKVLTNYVAAATSVGTASAPNPAPSGASSSNNPQKCDLIKNINNDEVSLVALINKFNSFYSAVSSLNSTIDNYKNYPTLDRDEFYCNIDNAIIKIKNAYKDATTRISLVDCNSLTGPYKRQFGAEGDEIVLQKDIYRKKLLDDATALAALYDQNKLLTGTCTTPGLSLSGSVEETVKKAKGLVETIDTKLSSNVDVITNNLKLLSTLQFTYNPGTVHVGETDELVLKLSVKDNVKNTIAVYSIATLPVYKAIKIDYSAGMFFSNLYDQSFTKTVTTTTDNTVDPAVDTDHYTLHDRDGGGLSYGAMGYINFHTQMQSFFNYGASLGAGLRFNESTKLALSPTISIYMGKYQRLILHAGVAFSQVDRIYSQYGDRSFTDANYVPETKPVVKAGYLFGLSWNLSRTK